ncbi:HIG1 domain family member 1A, mitochondrial-like [Oppia nitens]|uniref:HIG1 domain family member 1A, mitochondrial-like n=1 Tax=Oppia nitens TaxID=1686743 RepID=UPI0023DC9572|nr:HIG1 domain family member 1A, mitochondrial-like [Oppia nitens]
MPSTGSQQHNIDTTTPPTTTTLPMATQTHSVDPRQQQSASYYTEETSGGKLTRKARDNPFFPIALTGFGCAALYGAYRFKHRGDMPVSLYLIQLRVASQGIAVGTLTLGMVYMLGKRLYNNYYNIPNDPK